MWFLVVQIIVDLALALTAALLTARKGTSSKPGSFDPPTSDQATPLAVVFGTCVVTPQVMLWHNPRAFPFKKKNQDAGFTYHAEMLLGICYGPVDAIRDFVLDTTKLLSAVAPTRGLPVCTPALPIARPGDGLERDLVIYAEGAFGGPDHEGGIAGTVHLYFGTDAQTADPAMNFNLGSPPGVAVLPPYRRLCYAAFLDNGPALSTVRDFYFGTSSQLKAINVLVTRCPNRLGHGAMPNGLDANPVECIYDVLVDDWWGLAMPTSLFGSSWAAAAQTVQTEGTGSSRCVNDASLTGEEVIAEFLREIDGSVYTDPVTGLIEIQLVRAGDPVTFWVDADAIHDVEYTQPTWRDVGATGVKIKYSNRAKLYADDIAEWQNPGAVAALGQEITQEIALPGLCDAAVAAAIAAREGRVVTQPFARVSFKCDRRAYAFHKGTPFRFSDPELTRTSDRIFRAGAIDYGDLTDPTITVTAVEDVFGSAGAGSGVGSGTGTGSPIAPTPLVSAPDVVASTTETSTAETITLTVTDLSHLITATHGAVWQTQIAGGALSAATDFAQAWPGPYSVTIAKGAVAQTFTWTINYLDAYGAAQTITGTITIAAAATPSAPLLTLNVNPTTGAVTVGWTGDPRTTQVKIAASKTGYPSDATVRAGAFLAGQTGTTGTLVTLAAGELVYVTAFAYTSDTPPVESAHALATNATSTPGTYIPLAQKGAASGVATLDGSGLVPAAQMPPLAISEVFVVASQAAMLALTAQRGDLALRTDLSETFVLATDSPSTLADWKQLLVPLDAPSGPAGGDLSGTYPNPAVAKLDGVPVDNHTVAPVAGQALLYDAVAGKYKPGSASGGSTARSTVSYTTASLANGATETGTITIPASATECLLDVLSSSALAWIRVYTTAAARAADASRAITSDPNPGTGVLAEFYTATTVVASPPCTCINTDTTPASTLYISIQNQSGGATAITVTFTLKPL